MRQNGFTMVEVIVAIVVAGMFMILIFGVSTLITQLSSSNSQSHAASSLAYANMRMYANGRAPTWFACPSPDTNSVTILTSNAAVASLPSPVAQTVVADAPYGCESTDSVGLPIRVTSTVTYGPNNLVVKYSTYANY